MNYGVGLFSVLVVTAVWDCFTYQVCNYLWNCVKGKFENGLKIQCSTHTKISWDKPIFFTLLHLLSLQGHLKGEL